jgi:hypothetical protein
MEENYIGGSHNQAVALPSFIYDTTKQTVRLQLSGCKYVPFWWVIARPLQRKSIVAKTTRSSGGAAPLDLEINPPRRFVDPAHRLPAELRQKPEKAMKDFKPTN